MSGNHADTPTTTTPSTAKSEARVHTIKTARHSLRHYAAAILARHPLHRQLEAAAEPAADQIRIVCISDTHNERPPTPLPPGDILIHAGDLTDSGSFDEVQAGLDWLAAQPHRHKIYVAGNHDVLLDAAFLARHPERRYGSAKTADADLVWPDSVVYLNDRSIVLELDPPGSTDRQQQRRRRRRRQLKVYGSPYTPEYVSSAFQYPRAAADATWVDRMPADADIVVTHGPPRLHLDAYAGIPRGCAFLAREIARVRPRVHVFGHIHAGYGRDDVVFDRTRRNYEEIVNFAHYDEGWWWLPVWAWTLAHMALATVWCWTRVALLGRKRVESRWARSRTTLVNASVVAWNAHERRNEWRNEAIVVAL